MRVNSQQVPSEVLRGTLEATRPVSAPSIICCLLILGFLALLFIEDSPSFFLFPPGVDALSASCIKVQVE